MIPTVRSPRRRDLLTGGVASVALAGAGAAGGAYGSGWRPFNKDVPVPAPIAKASGGNGMNAVLIVVDSVRPDYVGAYGADVHTPNLDAFAASATRFTQAYPEAMPTIPVRRAVHTGLRTYPAREWKQLKDNPPLPGWQPVPDHQSTLAELLGQVGYTRLLLADTSQLMRPYMNFTRGFSAFRWTRGQKGDRYGLPEAIPDEAVKPYLLPSESMDGFGAGAVRYHLANHAEMKREEEWPAPQLFTHAAGMLDQLREVEPFLLVVDTFEPHEPFLTPPGYVDRYSDGPVGDMEPAQPYYGKGDYSDAEIERMRALYSGGLTFTDRWIGRFLDALTEKGMDESTLVIVLSDHGVMLGDHGYTGKPTHALYPGLTDIMMMARHPQRGHGVVSDLKASTHDVTPTILSALDVHVDGSFHGSDMLATDGAVADRKHATAMYADTLWVRDERWLLIGWDYGNDCQLYDMANDPELRDNVADREERTVRQMLDYARSEAKGDMPHYEL